MLILHVLPLAFPSLLVGQTRGVRSQHVDLGSLLLWLGIAAAVIGTISVAAHLAHRVSLRRRLDSHPGLFDGLCRVHGLDRGQRSLLLQVVHARNISYPGQVFTEPKWTNPKAVPRPLNGKIGELGNLHKKLFG